MARKPKISVSIKGENLEKNDVSNILDVADQLIEEDVINPGYIVSRLNHPVTLSYEGNAIVIPPHANETNKIRIANVKKLGHLIPGVYLIPEKKLI